MPLAGPRPGIVYAACHVYELSSLTAGGNFAPQKDLDSSAGRVKAMAASDSAENLFEKKNETSVVIPSGASLLLV